jgi:vancomycin resistance protein VanJ
MAMEEASSPTNAHQPLAHDRPASTARRLRWQRWLACLVIVYGVTIVAVWEWMYRFGDRNWLATIFLFGPRWICAIPLPLLALAAAVYYRRMLLPLALTAVVIIVPIMSFAMHWPAPANSVGLRVMTCNVNGDASIANALSALIDKARPDLVALQEVSSAPQFHWPNGWHVLHHGEFILASRFPLKACENVRNPAWPDAPSAVRFTAQLPQREIQLFNVHLMSPRPGLEAVLNRKTGVDISQAGRLNGVLQMRAIESQKISAWISNFPGAKIVMGDFNAPIESTVFRRCWSSLNNAFSQTGYGFGFTKVTAKRGWNYGARIDHVLYSPEWHCVRCWVGADVGSDHLPLLAEFE